MDSHSRVPLLEGYLTKFSFFKRVWKKRWFVLTDLGVEYYQFRPPPGDSSVPRKGQIPHVGALIEIADEIKLGRPYGFTLTSKSGLCIQLGLSYPSWMNVSPHGSDSCCQRR